MALNLMHYRFPIKVFPDFQVSHVGLSALLSGRFGETIEDFKFTLKAGDRNARKASSQVVRAIKYKTIENKRFIHPDSQLTREMNYINFRN